MEFIYEKLEHNELLNTLKNNKTVCNTLVYMVTFQFYDELKVVPKKHSIEIFNENISLSIILYVGFETKEYSNIFERKNYHIVSFSKFTKEMQEFVEISEEIKFIEPKALFYTALSFSNDNFINDLKTILEI
ncbi:MAG: hypothetical protein U0T80_11960 [Flavobacteriaceae bacterium]